MCQEGDLCPPRPITLVLRYLLIGALEIEVVGVAVRGVLGSLEKCGEGPTRFWWLDVAARSERVWGPGLRQFLVPRRFLGAREPGVLEIRRWRLSRGDVDRRGSTSEPMDICFGRLQATSEERDLERSKI